MNNSWSGQTRGSAPTVVGVLNHSPLSSAAFIAQRRKNSKLYTLN